MAVWREAFVRPTASILEAIRVIERDGVQIALVVDEYGRLLGTVTDGDVRRAILKGIAFSEPVEKVMNPHPVSGNVEKTDLELFELMKLKMVNQLPVVDANGRVVGLRVLSEMLQSPQKSNRVVLMAGGLGNRLQPLTNECPKPLLKVGSRPILHGILDRFLAQGFRQFYISVNYKAEMIMDYFGDGSAFGASIEYLREPTRMGTAGALSLIPQLPEAPLIVMNGDLITDTNFNQLLEFHKKHKVAATMCIRRHEFQVPYGVVQINEHQFDRMDEKPLQQFFVNAGIYVIEPTLLSMVPANSYVDMPDLFKRARISEKEVAVFPLREHWLDIGSTDDFRRAEDYMANMDKKLADGNRILPQ